jgi:hypothetical protein
MFKPHKAVCLRCNKETIVVVKKMWCRSCNEAQKLNRKGGKKWVKTFAPIPKRSEKRVKLDAAYSVLRKAYLTDHPHCFANIKGICTHEATQIHHLHWGKDREKHMNDFANVVGLCFYCHQYTHDVMSKTEAMERGLKKLDNEPT